jgi:hypothetical protein
VREEPIPSKAGSHKFVDLCSATSRLLIEVKWVGRRGRWKRILEEVYVDIQTYPAHPACETLAFIVVDAVKDIPDPRLVERQISGRQTVMSREVDVRLFVTEP